jgi:hypothetical protein
MTTLHAPFLTDVQVEELDTRGMIDLDDETLDRLLSWAGCDTLSTDH